VIKPTRKVTNAIACKIGEKGRELGMRSPTSYWSYYDHFRNIVTWLVSIIACWHCPAQRLLIPRPCRACDSFPTVKNRVVKPWQPRTPRILSYFPGEIIRGPVLGRGSSPFGRSTLTLHVTLTRMTSITERPLALYVILSINSTISQPVLLLWPTDGGPAFLLISRR